MIGLGSNRLTVCRRGGMSVTQAGRGGMEWLAGGRVPRWASPYSAQATAALKAQFPTQWPTIRDYGFAHPEIVGYMNAYAPEDAKIAYSLVPTIGYRWIKGDGLAYFNTGEAVDATATYSTIIQADTTELTSAGFMVGCRTSSSTQRLQIQLWRGDQTVYTALQTTNVNSGADWATPHNVIADIPNGKTFVDGVEQMSGVTGSYSNINICLFTIYSGTNRETPCKHYMAEYRKTKNGVDIIWWVPFIRENVIGMLDLVSGTFYQNAGSGSFTISETPAS